MVKLVQNEICQKLIEPIINIWFWFKVILLIIFVILISIIFDPFGWESAPEQKADVFIQQFTAPLKPVDLDPVVTVILIDESYYNKGEKASWPIPSREFNFKILNKILTHEPLALFLDISYPDAPREVTRQNPKTRKEALETLIDAFKKSKKAKSGLKPPILIGDAIIPPTSSTTNTNCKDYSNNETKYQCVKEKLLQNNILAEYVVNNAAGEDSQLHIVDVGRDLESNDYLLASDYFTEITGSNIYFASPALALYKIYADRTKLDNELNKRWIKSNQDIKETAPWFDRYVTFQYQPRKCGCCPQSQKKQDETLSVEWGYYQSPSMIKLNALALGYPAPSSQTSKANALSLQTTHTNDAEDYQSCKVNSLHMMNDKNNVIPKPHQTLLRAYDSLKNYLHAVFFTSFLKVESTTPCSAFNQFPASYLDPRKISSKVEGNTIDYDAFKKQIGTLIKDKIVMVGTKLPQTKDITFSPINKHIPGVFLHAAALQNLIAKGNNFSRPKSYLAKIINTALFIIFFAYLSKVLPDIFSKYRSPVFSVIKILLVILVPWIVIFGLSHANLPLATGLIGGIIVFLDSVKAKINKIETDAHLQENLRGRFKAILQWIKNKLPR